MKSGATNTCQNIDWPNTNYHFTKTSKSTLITTRPRHRRVVVVISVDFDVIIRVVMRVHECVVINFRARLPTTLTYIAFHSKQRIR